MVRDYIKREAERRHPLAVSQYDYPTEQRAVRDFCEGAGWATEETMRKALEYLKKMPPAFIEGFIKHMNHE